MCNIVTIIHITIFLIINFKQKIVKELSLIYNQICIEKTFTHAHTGLNIREILLCLLRQDSNIRLLGETVFRLDVRFQTSLAT